MRGCRLEGFIPQDQCGQRGLNLTPLLPKRGWTPAGTKGYTPSAGGGVVEGERPPWGASATLQRHRGRERFLRRRGRQRGEGKTRRGLKVEEAAPSLADCPPSQLFRRDRLLFTSTCSTGTSRGRGPPPPLPLRLSSTFHQGKGG